MKKFLEFIPRALSSTVSIFIFIFLFVYLILFGLIGLVATSIAPSAEAQLILGNYTNVTSALGAAIAAGASTAVHASVKKLHRRHDRLEASINELHGKIDKLTRK
jgi:cell division protein FtsB